MQPDSGQDDCGLCQSPRVLKSQVTVECMTPAESKIFRAGN